MSIRTETCESGSANMSMPRVKITNLSHTNYNMYHMDLVSFIQTKLPVPKTISAVFRASRRQKIRQRLTQDSHIRSPNELFAPARWDVALIKGKGVKSKALPSRPRQTTRLPTKQYGLEHSSRKNGNLDAYLCSRF